MLHNYKILLYNNLEKKPTSNNLTLENEHQYIPSQND